MLTDTEQTKIVFDSDRSANLLIHRSTGGPNKLLILIDKQNAEAVLKCLQNVTSTATALVDIFVAEFNNSEVTWKH